MSEIPELSMADSKFIDDALNRILDKYKSSGGLGNRLDMSYADYILTTLFYMEGRSAVRKYVRDYTYDPKQKRQPVYIKEYDQYSDPYEAASARRAARESSKRTYRKRTTANSNANRKVFCDGVVYPSLKDCASHYGVRSPCMCSWLKGNTEMPERFIKLGLRYESI